MVDLRPSQKPSRVIIQLRFGQPFDDAGALVRGRNGRLVGRKVVGLAVAPSLKGAPVGARDGAGDGSGVSGLVGTHVTPMVGDAAMRRNHRVGQVLVPFVAVQARVVEDPPRHGTQRGGHRTVGDLVGALMLSSVVGLMMGRRVRRVGRRRTGCGVRLIIS